MTPPDAPATCGMVLAGGGGRRFGGPKAAAAFAGSTLVEHAVAALAASCGTVVVVSRPGVPLPRLDCPVVFDRPGPDAPLVAVATGLAALSGEDCVVLACDLPLAEPVIGRLLAAPAGIAAVAVDPEGRAQSLCARYPRAVTLTACERLLATGAVAMRDLLDAVPWSPVEGSARELLNVATPDDLARAEG